MCFFQFAQAQKGKGRFYSSQNKSRTLVAALRYAIASRAKAAKQNPEKFRGRGVGPVGRVTVTGGIANNLFFFKMSPHQSLLRICSR